jgi:protein toll
VAHQKAIEERRSRIIVIVYGDLEKMTDITPEMQAYLSTNTYVKWSDPWFWQRLKYALPKKRNSLSVPTNNKLNGHLNGGALDHKNCETLYPKIELKAVEVS